MKKYARQGAIPVLSIENPNDLESIACVCEALSHKKRLEIMRILQIPPCSISVTELSKKTKIPISTLKHHLNVLENACLIITSFQTSKYGTVKIVSRDLHGVNLQLHSNIIPFSQEKHQSEKISVGVGQYSNVYSNNFGFTTAEELFLFLGENCFHPKRFDSQLVFSTNGKIEYFIDNKITKTHDIKKMKISLEICSETPFYNNDFLSDITFWINDVEVLTYTSYGDYGGRKGILNPEWWPMQNTQYGKLIEIYIDESGVYLEQNLIHSRVTIDKLNLPIGNRISLKIGNKGTSKYIGGWNIFGKEFGDHPQDIEIELFY